VRKARQAGALFGGRLPGRGQRSPEVCWLIHREVGEVERREGALGSGEDFLGGFAEGEPERSESPGEQERFRPDLNRWGARRSPAFSVGASR